MNIGVSVQGHSITKAAKSTLVHMRTIKRRFPRNSSLKTEEWVISQVKSGKVRTKNESLDHIYVYIRENCS